MSGDNFIRMEVFLTDGLDYKWFGIPIRNWSINKGNFTNIRLRNRGML